MSEKEIVIESNKNLRSESGALKCFLCKKKFAEHLLFKCKCNNKYCLKDITLEKHNCISITKFKYDTEDKLIKNSIRAVKVDII